MALQEFHERHGARFGEVNGMVVVEDYGDVLGEHAAMHSSAGVLDLSFRSRLCVTGSDRARFLNGQVTNNVKDLQPGQGCYAALVNAKGRLESDLNIHCLTEELLLDFEPGMTAAVLQRLDRYLVADDVQLVDVSAPYGMLAVLGPRASEVIVKLQPGFALPAQPLASVTVRDEAHGDVMMVNHSRGAEAGFDMFVPTAILPLIAQKLLDDARVLGGRLCGWQALETIRIEAGLPRFGADMDETNLAPEAGIETRAISASKGCYVGQEIINRLRTFAHVNRTLCGFRIAGGPAQLPQRGDKLLFGDKEIGHITSALASPRFGCNIALGYARREASAVGTALTVRSLAGDITAIVVPVPFSTESLG